MRGCKKQRRKSLSLKFQQSAAGGTGGFHPPVKVGQLVSATCTRRGHRSIPDTHRYSPMLLHSDSFSCRAAMARRRCSFSCSISRSERTLM